MVTSRHRPPKFETKKSPLPGGRLMPRIRPGASILDCDRDALSSRSSFTTVQKRRITYTVGDAQARFICMKSTCKKRTPSIVNLTVKRRYLTQREIDRLIDCARKYGRYGHRDATMILVAYCHGLRAPRYATCNVSRSSYPRAACTFTASRMAFPVCIRSAVTRCERCVSYAAITLERLTCSFPNAVGRSAPSASIASSSVSARPPRCHSRKRLHDERRGKP